MATSAAATGGAPPQSLSLSHHHHHHAAEATAASRQRHASSADGASPSPTAADAGGKGVTSAPSPPLGVSASVGHDHWANDVLSAVKGHASPPPLPPPASGVVADAAPPDDPVAGLVLEKKKKFHSGRMLEVKNLPDDCTEQVRGEHQQVLSPGGSPLVNLAPPFSFGEKLGPSVLGIAPLFHGQFVALHPWPRPQPLSRAHFLTCPL